MHESCTPRPHFCTSGLSNCSIHPRQAVSTFGRTWLPKPGSVLQSVCQRVRVCICVPAHITHTPAGPRAQRTNDSNRVELIAEHSRTKPNRAERRRVGAGAKAGSSGWPNQSAVGRIANLLLAVLRCAQRE